MANFIYPWARNAFLVNHAGSVTWNPNWASDTVKLLFLNAGVGTNYVWSGSGASGYAWQPATDESNILAQSGYAVTYVSQIPHTHRTMSAAAAFSGSPPSFAGGAITTTLANQATLGNGVADADDITVYAVTAGAAVSAFVLYRYYDYNSGSASADSTGSDARSHLIAFFDSAIGMPVLGNGGDITVVWNSGNTRIFKI